MRAVFFRAGFCTLLFAETPVDLHYLLGNRSRVILTVHHSHASIGGHVKCMQGVLADQGAQMHDHTDPERNRN